MTCDDGRSFFHDAEVTHEGRTLRFSAEEARERQSAGNDWHGPASPSTWLATSVFEHVRARFALPNEPALALAARSLGITVDDLRGKIEWHENDMRWHVGVVRPPRALAGLAGRVVVRGAALRPAREARSRSLRRTTEGDPDDRVL